MSKHIETLLTSAGLPAEDVQKIMSLPEAEQEKFDVKPFVDKVKSNFSAQLANDPEFFSNITVDKLPAAIKKQIEAEQFGRAANISRDKVLKGLGMTESDLEDLPEDQRKKIETLIPAVIEKWTKTKSGSKETQEELIRTRKELERYAGLEEKLKTQYETEANTKVKSVIFSAALVSELSSLPGLKIAASDIAKTASDILTSKFAFEKVGDFGIELRQKDHPELQVLKTGSSQQLTLKEALAEIATERGWIEQPSDAKKSQKGTLTVAPDKNGKSALVGVAPHLENRISQKIAAQQK